MDKKVVLVVIVALVVVGGGAAFLLTSKNKNTDNTANMSMSNSTSSTSSSSPTATNSVAIENFAFSPASITIKKGTTVTWTNKDSVAHTVTENDGQQGPDSGSLPNGKTYSFTYNTVGTFKYHCAVHPEMVGTVTVTN